MQLGQDEIAAVVARAEGGDADAQYMLAALLNGARRADEARMWLDRAARQGQPDALYTVATAHLQGAGGRARDTAAAAEALDRAAERGGAAAKRLLAVLRAIGATGAPGANGWASAVDLVLDVAQAGDIAAQRETAMLLFLRDADDEDGARLVDATARRDVLSAALCVRRAMLGRTGASGATAREVALHLARAGHPCTDELTQAGVADCAGSAPGGPVDWTNVRARLTAAPAAGAPDFEQLSDRPNVRLARGVLSREACDYMMGAAAPRLAPSFVVDPRDGTNKPDPHRRSATATLWPVDLDLALVQINTLIAAASGQAPETAEMLSILRYLPGEAYLPHYDWLPPSEELDRSGQRVATTLVYLNAGFEGGETQFLTPGLEVKGAPGDLVLFANVDGDGAPDQASRHAGAAVRQGQKWLASTWFRARRYVW